MSTAEELRAPLEARSMGTDVERRDAVEKVTGRAAYAVEHPAPDALHVHLVQATIALGRISALDTTAARRADGVVAVLDHTNAPRLADRSDKEHDVLQDDAVHFRGQVIAVVLAQSPEQARAAAELLEISYEERAGQFELTAEAADYKPDSVNPDFSTDSNTGRLDLGLEAADVLVEETYETPLQHNNPMEPHGYLVRWDPDANDGRGSLDLFASTQHVQGVAQTVAGKFGLVPEQVRVRAPYVGGGFGSKGEPHVTDVLVAMAALAVPGRPVKLAVTRQQMFSLTGYRTSTISRIRLGADANGALRAIDHQAFSQTSRIKEYAEQTAVTTRMMYAAPNRHTSHRLARLDVSVPSWMRAPGVWPGTHALEVAMDELADRLGIDPIDLRAGNEPQTDPDTGRPFGDRRLLECLRIGAERFGWSERTPPGEHLDGDWRIGHGVAASTYPAEAMPGNAASVTLGKHGRHTVAIAASDIGTGARTALALVAADALGLDPAVIDVELGDSTLPMASVAGGSSGTTSWGTAIVAAARAFRDEHGDDPSQGATTLAKAPSFPTLDEFANHSFGAQFVELAVHRLTGELRVRRMLGIFSVGRVVNPRGARSQLVGGMVMGMSVGLLEDAFRDPRFGHVVTQDLATYHVAANADVPDIEVDWLDPGTGAAINPMASRGIGEIGIVGTAAAIANAAYNATGVRVRSLPVTADHFLP